MASEPATNPETVADRLAAAGVRVRSVWLNDGRVDETWYSTREVDGRFVAACMIHHACSSDDVWEIGRYEDEQQAADACQNHFAAAVLSMLEVVPIQEPPR